MSVSTTFGRSTGSARSSAWWCSALWPVCSPSRSGSSSSPAPPCRMAEGLGLAPRRAEPAELPALARMLARAFHEDPVAAWACRPDRVRPRGLEQLFGLRLRDIHPRGEIWTDDDRQSVAAWNAPDQWHTTPRQDVAYATSLLHPRLLLRMPMVVTGMLGAQKVHPAEPPHRYLAILGTDPSAQGRGLGSALDAAGAGGLRPRRRGGLPRVLQGAEPRLLRAARVPGHGRAAAPARAEP